MPDPTPRTRRPRADAERSRAAVLDAAVEVLGRQPDASVETIAATAGVVRQTVYAHFPSRDALLSAVVDRITAETAAALDALDLGAGSAAAALRRWLGASWHIIERYPVLLSPVVAEVSTGDEQESHRPITGGLTELLQRGQRSAEFDDQVPVEWLMAAVIALGHAAGQEAAAGRMSVPDAGRAYRESVLRLTTSRRWQ